MSALLEIREVRIVLNAFWPMLKQGLIYSIPLTLVSFAIGMVIAIMSALLIINRVPLLSQLMRFYVWIFRGTPLLVASSDLAAILVESKSPVVTCQ